MCGCVHRLRDSNRICHGVVPGHDRPSGCRIWGRRTQSTCAYVSRCRNNLISKLWETIILTITAETAPPWIRGALVCTYQLFITLGIFLAACFNFGTNTHQQDNSGSWRIVIGLGWVWTLILGIGILFFRETPRYDYRHGRIEEAKETLCRVYGAPANHYSIHIQLEEIESKLRSETDNSGGMVREFAGMFRAPRMPYRIALGMTLQAFQQLTGANYFFYYGTTIFKSVQIDSFVTQMILNAINFGTTFIGLYLIEHYGRRKSLIAGSIWMFVCFIVFASVGHFALNIDHPELTPPPGIALIVFACLFILAYATTWGPVSNVPVLGYHNFEVNLANYAAMCR